MAYKSKREKKAYRVGLLTGLRRKKRTTGTKKNVQKKKKYGTKRRRLSKDDSKEKKVSNPNPRTAPFTTDKKGRINGYNPKYPHKEPDLFIESVLLKRELF